MQEAERVLDRIDQLHLEFAKRAAVCSSCSVTSYFTSDRGAKYCDQHVCLSVCLLAYLKNHTSTFHQIVCTCYLWPGLGHPLTAM